ncbi:hypothetical protein GCM10023197_43510 [Gordonia humi]|nr:DUF4328 domain-containing protein [Gordonia humi]
MPRPALRWTAHRPAEAVPAPRPPRGRAPGPTPSYATIPGWGLIDAPRAAEVDADPVPEATQAFTGALRIAGLSLAAAAVVHAVRYIVAVVNRTRPIPAWIDWLTGVAVFVFGLMALVAVVMTLIAFGRWVRRLRVRQYAHAGFVDPRKALWVYVLSIVPLVNVVGAPWLLHESAAIGGPDPRSLRVRMRLAGAWAIVNAVAVVAVAYRIAAWTTDSLQVDADGLALVVLTFAVSAVFARWSIRRFEVLSGVDADEETAPVRRLVAV